MWIVLALLLVLLMLSGAAIYLLYAPRAAVPLAQGTLARRQLAVAQSARRYDTYVPRELVPDAPLVIVLHSVGQNPESIRALLGQALEQQARLCGFAVAYPEAGEGGWRAASATDEAAFIQALIGAMAAEHAVDPARVFVLGYGSGGQMAYRLALTVPQCLAGVAAVATSLPAGDAAAPLVEHAVPMMIVNGTADRLNPFKGGTGSFFGLARRESVRSSMATAQYFADLAGARLQQDDTQSDHLLPRLAPMRSEWTNAEGIAVVLFAVKGGGHVVHQPYARQARWLGAMNPGFDVAAQACVFWAL